MSAQLTAAIGKLSDRQSMLQSQIADSAGRATEIVTHLLDLTKARLGTGLPILKEAMDMGFVSHQLVDEMRAIHPNREIEIEATGEIEGNWDKARIGQVFSNLIGTAVQYGFRGTPIWVKVHGTSKEIIVSVHNEGVPIDPEALPNIFDSLTRAEPATEDASASSGTNLGLGLYITKEIVVAHGGEINVRPRNRTVRHSRRSCRGRM